jgi:hypothetical protein
VGVSLNLGLFDSFLVSAFEHDRDVTHSYRRDGVFPGPCSLPVGVLLSCWRATLTTVAFALVWHAALLYSGLPFTRHAAIWPGASPSACLMRHLSF